METFPRWGTMRGGEFWELLTPERPTSGTESGLWLTPCATDAKPITGGNLYQTATGTVRHMRPDGRSSNRGLDAQVRWPMIRAQDGERGGRGDLIQAVRGNENSHFRMWQTPVADDAVNRAAGKFNSRGEPKLSAQVKFPTPLTRDWKSGTGADHGAHSPPLSSVVGGQLNPDWTEWLMGWPIGWTDLKPLETDKFQQWQQQHSAFSRKG